MDELSDLTAEQKEFCTDMLFYANGVLEEKGNSVTNRAFNQGYIVGILPVGIFILGYSSNKPGVFRHIKAVIL